MSTIPGSNYVQIHHPETKAVSEVDPRSVPMWEGAGWKLGALTEPTAEQEGAPETVAPPSAPATPPHARARKAADSAE